MLLLTEFALHWKDNSARRIVVNLHLNLSLFHLVLCLVTICIKYSTSKLVVEIEAKNTNSSEPVFVVSV